MLGHVESRAKGMKNNNTVFSLSPIQNAHDVCFGFDSSGEENAIGIH
jgi:hypothetical protein